MSHPILDRWLVRRMGWPEINDVPTRRQLFQWQMARLRETLFHARTHSPFYARLYGKTPIPDTLTTEEYARLPMITPDDLRRSPEQFLCVSQDEIARVVTLESSGTTGSPKRVFHTQEDLEATKDYFDWGMRPLVEPGQTALVLMPGGRPGGVGRLLMEALERTGARAVPHGVLEDARTGVNHLLEEGAACIVGSPPHVNMLTREWERRDLPKDMIRSVLFCWDEIPDAVCFNAKNAFGCTVFRHWGMIETGLGGAVECEHGRGMHLRETDVFVEIVDPETGNLLPDGRFGEVIVSTPMRRGMPLLRYRTGDRGRILTGECACGSPLRRLDPLITRMHGGVPLETGTLTLSTLGKALYALPGLWDFTAWFSKNTLHIQVCGDSACPADKVRTALTNIPTVQAALAGKTLKLAVKVRNTTTPAVPGLGKRRLLTTEP